MARVRVLILRAAGTNCDFETEHAWSLAGAHSERIHIRALIDSPHRLTSFQVLTIPGGFSYGDDIAAGAIMASQLRRRLYDHIADFVSRGGLVLGICNGFQVLVKAGLLPLPAPAGARPCTLTCNDPPGFQDRWVTLRGMTDRCVFVEMNRLYEMPIAHGEGRVTFSSQAHATSLIDSGHAALAYATSPDNAHSVASAPHNPNGSHSDLAGLCDQTGRVMGLMPHPDRFVEWIQHPLHTALPPRPHGDGLALFQAALRALR